jgi:hypothetical protein
MVVPENASVCTDVHYDVMRHEEQCAFINNNMRPDWDKQAIRILEDKYEALKHVMSSTFLCVALQ